MPQSTGACFLCRSSAVLYCFVGFADREVQGVSGIPGGGSLSLPLRAGRGGRTCRAFPCKGASYGSWKDVNLKSPMHDARAGSEERSGLGAYQANFKQRCNSAELGS